MKALTIVLAVALAAIALTGCTNVRERSLPAKAALTNPCFSPCGPR